MPAQHPMLRFVSHVKLLPSFLRVGVSLTFPSVGTLITPSVNLLGGWLSNALNPRLR